MWTGELEAAGMIDGVNRHLALVGGVESVSRVQLGLDQSLSDWLRKFQQARSRGEKAAHLAELSLGDIRLEHGRAHGDHGEGVEHRA